MSIDREWMYRRIWNSNLTTEFVLGLDTFIEFACGQPQFMNKQDIRCPCKKCKCKIFRDPNTVKLHLVKLGFMPNYKNWVFHGEPQQVPSTNAELRDEVLSNQYETMVLDAAAAGGLHFPNNEVVEEPPNPQAEELYSMLNAAKKELWPGCTTHSQLSFVARMMNIKSENHLSEKCFDELLQLIREIVPKDNCIPKDFYSSKKLLRGMGLPVEEIHCCRNSCMLFWGNDVELSRCKFCDASRYKDNYGESSSRRGTLVPYSKMYYFPLTPRLQRLYASRATANEMRWHASSWSDGVMRHPANSPAWKHFSDTYPGFASETRNVRLGLSTDGFQPFGQSGKQYSSWLVVLTPYNLPLWLCMKEQFMFLTLIVSCPHNPKEMIDVYLQPLIVELKLLWDNDVNTYDVSLKQNFQMRVALFWT